MVERKKITQKGFKNRQTKVPVENLPGYKRVQPDDYVAQPGHPQYSKGSLPLVTNKGNLGGAVDNSRLAAGAAEKNARATEEKLEAELARLREETEQQYNQKMEEKRKSTVITENPHRSRPALSLSPSLFVVVSLCVQVSLCL